MDIDSLDTFTRAYIECALWSSHTVPPGTDCEESLDENHTIEDIAPETLAAMIADCKAFQERNDTLIHRAFYKSQTRYTAENAGHDFWLTRCGHGAGFWDRGLDQIGDDLTAVCEAYWPNVDLYVGDDNKIYA